MGVQVYRVILPEEIRRKRQLQKIRLIVSLALLFIGLWQLEMVWIGHTVSWGYSFAWFGDLGLPLWYWRDFWYVLLFVAWLIKPVKDIAGVVFKPPIDKS